MRRGSKLAKGCRFRVDNKGLDFRDSANAENFGICQRNGDVLLGIEQWK